MGATSVGIAVVGLGAIGQEHLAVYRALPGVRVAAVADFDGDRARTHGDALGVPAYRDVAEVLAARDVDAVSLCTPDQLHFEDARAVLGAGRHLLLEKPIATTVEEADELVRVAEAAALVALPGHVLHFDGRYVTARDHVASGALGDVVHGYVRRDNKTSVAERVRGRTSVTYFLGVHDIEIVTWITGRRVVEVQAMQTGHRTPDGAQAVATLAALRLDNGAVVQLEAAWGLPETHPSDLDARLRLVGTRGELAIDILEQGVRVVGDRVGFPFPSAAPIEGSPQGALAEELRAFVRCIREGLPSPVPMRAAADAVRVAAAIDASVAQDAPVRVEYPPAP